MTSTIVTHAAHSACYAAILTSEAMHTPVSHELKMAGYGALVLLGLVAISHAFIATIMHRRSKKQQAESEDN